MNRNMWIDIFFSYYSKINVLYKKTFWIVFGVSLVVFSFTMIHFLWGNHDFGYMISGLPWEGRLFEGRFSAFYIQQLTEGQILPIINQILFCAGLAFSALAACYYWKLPENLYIWVFVSLLLVLQPNTLSWLYYVHMSLTAAWMPFILILSFINIEKSAQGVKSFAVSIVMQVICWGGNPAILNTMAVVLSGKLLTEVLRHSVTVKHLVRVLKKNAVVYASVLLSLAIFKIILVYLQKIGLLNVNNYNIQTVSIAGLPEAFVKAVKQSFESLLETYAFMDLKYKLVLLSLVLLSLIAVSAYAKKCKEKRSSHYTLVLIMFLIVLVASNLIGFVSKFDTSYPRLHFYGLAYFYAFCGGLIFIYGNVFIKNIGSVLIFLIIILSINRDLYAQKVWKLAFDNEVLLSNRMLSRIESFENFNPNKCYIYLQAGSYDSSREKFYRKEKNMKRTDDLFEFTFVPKWRPGDMLNFIALKRFICKQANLQVNQSMFDTKADEQLSDFILHEAQVWPHKKSVYVAGDYILVVMSPTALNKLKKYICSSEGC